MLLVAPLIRARRGNDFTETLSISHVDMIISRCNAKALCDLILKFAVTLWNRGWNKLHDLTFPCSRPTTLVPLLCSSRTICVASVTWWQGGDGEKCVATIIMLNTAYLPKYLPLVTTCLTAVHLDLRTEKRTCHLEMHENCV